MVVPSDVLRNKAHWKYTIKISNRGKTRYFEYNGSVHDYDKSLGLNKKDVMYCLISDMNAYESYENDPKGFCDAFGYEYDKNGLKVYNGCKTNSLKMRYLFNVDELNKLQEEFENY
jgi:hypothetical protein